VRVLFVTHSFPRWSGDVAGAFILHLARALAGAGVEVRVLAPSAPDLAATETIDGITVQRFRYASDDRETLAYQGTMAEQVAGSLGGKLAMLGMLRHGRRAVGELSATFAPDVIHAHWWFPSGLIAAAAHHRAPLVTTLHGSDVRLARKTMWAPRLLRYVVTRSAAVTAVSSWLAAEARVLAPGPGTSVAVEPMAVNVDLFTPGGERSAARFLFVGRLNAQKGLSFLLGALAASASGASLDVVGDGPDRETLDVRARTLGVDSRVTYHGAMPQDRLASFYRAATAVIIPGEDEGLGLVAVEASLCGTPVIALRSGGVTDFVTHGETGILTEPGDTAALAAAMDALLARDDRGAELGHAARVAALARFSPGVVAARYKAIYDGVTHVS
jgi:glycosyltransferase involved in cell wall biosynthesis